MAYDVPAQVSIGRSLGMSPKAITSAASTPSPAATSGQRRRLGDARRADLEQRGRRRPGDHQPALDDLLGQRPELLRVELLVAGEQLERRAVEELRDRRPSYAVGQRGAAP